MPFQIASLRLRASLTSVKTVHYLGYIVSEKGVEVDQEKTKCISDWPPSNRDELRHFLGVASYYRKFIRGFAHIAAPLHALTEKSNVWHWSGQCEEAFVALRHLLQYCPSPGLIWNSHACMDTDASQKGIGDVLSQNNGGQARY